MKKIISFLSLLFTVSIANAEQIKVVDLQKDKFLEFIKNLQIFIFIPLVLSLLIITCLMLIENKLKKRGIDPSDYSNISVRMSLVFGFLISEFCFFVLWAIFLESLNSFYYFKIFYFLLSILFFVGYVLRITVSFSETHWSPLRILRFLFFFHFMLIILIILDFYCRF